MVQETVTVKVSMTRTFDASADAVWKTISDFSIVDQYVKGITQSKTEGRGVGVIRRIKFREHAEVVERLEALDEEKKTLTYSVLRTPLPMEGYVATMKVEDLGGDRCELVWESTFKTEIAQEVRIKKIIERLYTAGFEGLGELHRR
jgi:hypothetical protein